MRQRYVITAGKNKAGRQMYISSYDDAPNEWSISIVPYPTTKTRCYELLATVKRDLKEKESKFAIRKLQKDIPFEIVEWNEY